MRKFNIREQEIIKALVSYYKGHKNLNTVNVFLSDKVVDDNLKIVIRADGNYLVYFRPEERVDALFKVVEIFNLFRYLIDNQQIALIPGEIDNALFIGDVPIDTGDKKVVIFENGDYINRDDNFWYNSNDQLKYECFVITENQFKIKDFIASVPVVSPELESLVESDFITLEEKTLRATRFAAVVSFFAFLSALILPFFTRTTINEEQYNGCLNTIQGVEQTISNSVNQVSTAIDSSTIQITNAIDSIVIKEKKPSKK